MNTPIHPAFADASATTHDRVPSHERCEKSLREYMMKHFHEGAATQKEKSVAFREKYWQRSDAPPVKAAQAWEWDGEPWNMNAAYRDQNAPWLLSGDAPVLKGDIECIDESHARLIAAAPHLLAALDVLTTELESVWRSDGMRTPNRHVVAARAAIAKAKGSK